MVKIDRPVCRLVSMEGEYEVMCTLSNVDIANNLQ